jgi:hypothetical protein
MKHTKNLVPFTYFYNGTGKKLIHLFNYSFDKILRSIWNFPGNVLSTKMRKTEMTSAFMEFVILKERQDYWVLYWNFNHNTNVY